MPRRPGPRPGPPPIARAIRDRKGKIEVVRLAVGVSRVGEKSGPFPLARDGRAGIISTLRTDPVLRAAGGSPMYTPLNLFDQLLCQARRHLQLGRHREATTLFTRLAGFRELPADVAEETQARLAQLHLKRRRFAQARRHLTAALRYQPDNARYHYLL